MDPQLYPRLHPRLALPYISPTPTRLLVPRQSSPAQGQGASSGSTSPPPSSSSSDPGSSSSPSESSSSPSSSPTSHSSSEISSSPTSEPTSQPTSDPSSTPSSTPSPEPSSQPSSSSTPSITPSQSSLLQSSSPSPSASFQEQQASQSLSSTSSSFSAQTTLTSTIVTSIDGVPTTIVTAIPTTLSDSHSSSSTSSTRSIIIGCSIGGVALIAILTALTLFCKRQNYRKLRVFGRQRNTRSMLLEGEEFDDADIGPPLQRYRDYPGSMSSNSQLSGRPISPALTGYSNTMAQVAPLVATSSPHLLVRASESGSIFREAVWPPPGEPSRLVDPLLSASSQVDLGGIIDDVMGSHAASRPISFVAGHARRDTESSSEDRRHSRATSQTGLLPNRSESPLISQVKAHPPLFVTNATPPSPTHAVSPKNWLERSPQPAPKHDEDGDANIQMGEAL